MSDEPQDLSQAPADAQTLRTRAEERVRAMDLASRPTQTAEEIQRVLHELRVHQIELELQNEELRTAQAEIEAGRARYVDLYDLAPVGYCTLSQQGLILEANLTAATLLGAARGALIKQPFSRFILDEDQDVYYLHRKKLFEASEPQRCELRLVKPDGSDFWASLDGAFARGSDGEPVCHVVMSDIAERKLAEQALQESEERFRVIQEISPDGFTILHPARNEEGEIVDFTWVYENPAIARINGTDPQRVVGERLLDLFPEHRGTSLYAAYVDVANTGRPQVFEEVYVGEIVSKPTWLRLLIVPIAGGIANLAQDVTERKLAEEQLRQHVEDLRVRNDALTRLNAVTTERELRMIELKREVNELCLRLGEPPRHRIVALAQPTGAPTEDPA